jgi:hypothetical protein
MTVIATITFHALVVLMLGKKVHELRENEASCVHWHLLLFAQKRESMAIAPKQNEIENALGPI